MKKKSREPLLVLSGIFVIIAIISGALLVHHVSATFSSGDANENSSVEKEEFQYTLRANATDYQTAIFDDLLVAHENYISLKSETNRSAYAIAVVKNFVADFYTWSNKNGRTDVGGLQFIASDIQSDFKGYAIDNFYLYLNQYIEMYGQDSLITVSNVVIEDIVLDYEFEVGVEVDEETGEEIGVITEPVIKIDASWGYEISTLEEIEYFQQRAIFLLTEEEGRIVIRVIQEFIEEPIGFIEEPVEDLFY